MAIKRPDIYEHNNPNEPIVDGKNVKGNTFIVADTTEMLAIPKPKLRLGNRVRMPSGNIFIEYELIDLDNHNIIDSWKKVNSGGLEVVNTYGDIPSGEFIGQMVKVKNATGDTNIGKAIWAIYVYSTSVDNTWTILEREDSVTYKTSLNDSLTVPSNFTSGIIGKTAAQLKGKSFSEFVDLIFPDQPPTMSNRSASLGGVSNQSREVGDSITPSVTASFSRGYITNGDGSAGPLLVGLPNRYDFRIPGGTLDQTYNVSTLSQGHTFPSRVITQGGNTWSAIVYYDAGTGEYYNDKGVVSNIFDGSRGASSVGANSGTVTGYFRAFFGFSALETLTSSQIIALGSSSDGNSTTGATAPLSSARARTFTNVTATDVNGNPQYTFYCYPASFGNLSGLIMDGSSSVFGAIKTDLPNVTVTNQFGIVEEYRIYRSTATNAFGGNTLAFS